MRAIFCLGLLFLLAAPALADDTDMGTWDCSGSKPQSVAVAPGDHTYSWRGSCGGAEGFDVVVEPKTNPDLVMDQHVDPKTGQLVLHIVNKGKQTVTVKMHVFVGFA